ncbi:uncharacterized protein [Atheta coriaria]|uniref:uncharacterized protein n=1 Tax=Dalotia coriaria TaxID=877792 RepID=UPI0031F3623E
MSATYVDQLLNSTLIQTILAYVDHVPHICSETLLSLADRRAVQELLAGIPQSLRFDDFQSTLLYSFLLLFTINIVLICIAWSVFGKSICERFMKPATSKAIEELKASVSRLKLPKEHTPRI